MKLSKAQTRVLALMADGWELGKYEYFGGQAKLQKGGIGRGGVVRPIAPATFIALVRLKLIEAPDGRGFPVTRYTLSTARAAHGVE